MKVPEQKPNTSAVPGPTSEQKTPPAPKPQLFSDKMRKKKADLQVPTPTAQFALQNTPLMAQQFSQQDPGQIAPSSNSELPMPIQNLVREIQVHIEPSGSSEVRIQFDSSVFDGLRVSIRKADGGVAVTFTTNN